MTTVQRIEESLQDLVVDSARIRFDVKFQNRAMENIMGFKDIQKNLHTPSLLLDKTIQTLHELTRKSNSELTHLEARVV